MTPSLNEIAIQIAEPFGKQFEVPFLAMIKDRVDYLREKFMRQALEKNPGDRKYFLQSIVMPLKLSNAACGSRFTCTVRRTVERIPRPLRVNGILFDYFGATDGSNAFKYMNRGLEEYQSSGKYTNNIIGYRYVNGFGDVLDDLVPEVLIDGIFANPRDAHRFDCTSKASCKPDDMEYPVSGDILSLIIETAMDELRATDKPKDVDTDVNIDNGTTQTENTGVRA